MRVRWWRAEHRLASDVAAPDRTRSVPRASRTRKASTGKRHVLDVRAADLMILAQNGPLGFLWCHIPTATSPRAEPSLREA